MGILTKGVFEMRDVCSGEANVEDKARLLFVHVKYVNSDRDV